VSSRGKKKTTMAKLSRESKLRERRAEKKAKKDARRRESLTHSDAPETGEAGLVATGPHEDRGAE
jgi:hypothetical protein